MVARNKDTFAFNESSVDSVVPVDTIVRHRRGDPKGCKPWLNAPIDFALPQRGWPTEAPPGTIEKLLVMTSRDDRGESLFHSHDARYEGDTRPLLFYLARMAEKQPWLFEESR